MKRQAILIGAPGSIYSDNYLQGVDFDIKNYIKFLQSPSGGAWDKSEIIAVKNPDKEKLLKLVKTINADYVLTVFSGHGAYSLSGRTILAINRTQHLTLGNLVTKAPKQMFVVDTCRSFIDSGISGFLGEELRNFPSRLTKQQARIIFDNYLRKCENGAVICYSCSIGETSIDSNDGGYFTTSLLDKTQQWIERPSKFNILPINSAFTLAKNYLVTNLTDEQNPQLKTTRQRQFWFPFAIRKAIQTF
ncbi:MAG: caspase family protein [Bacteroidota bacterium]